MKINTRINISDYLQSELPHLHLLASFFTFLGLLPSNASISAMRGGVSWDSTWGTEQEVISGYQSQASDWTSDWLFPVIAAFFVFNSWFFYLKFKFSVMFLYFSCCLLFWVYSETVNFSQPSRHNKQIYICLFQTEAKSALVPSDVPPLFADLEDLRNVPEAVTCTRG